MRSILIDHQRRYPLWSVDDLCKLIHQSATGSEHAIIDEGHVRDWLLSELASLKTGPEEPLLDRITPDGQVVRVHLRPFVRLGLDPEALLQAFILTAEKITPSTNLLLQYADLASQLADDGILLIAAPDISQRVKQLASDGFPAVHHSRRYEKAYLPAYRVVAREALPSEFLASA